MLTFFKKRLSVLLMLFALGVLVTTEPYLSTNIGSSFKEYEITPLDDTIEQDDPIV